MPRIDAKLRGKLAELMNTHLSTLQSRVGELAETFTRAQVREWKRGDLILYLLDDWIEKQDEGPGPEGEVHGAMYRDGVCSCCGEDGIARLTLVDRSDGTYTGKTLLQLCTECEQKVVGASDYIKVGTETEPLLCAACGQAKAEQQGGK